MTDQTIYKRSSEVVAATVGEKAFLLHISDWIYLELNEIGRRIWELLDEGKTVPQVVDKLEEEFAVERELCTSDTAELLNTLEEKHFVTRC